MLAFESVETDIDAVMSSSSDRYTLWLERGYSRSQIGARMLAAVPDMRLLTSPQQPVPGSPVLPFPEPGSTDAVQRMNNAISEYDIDAIWPQFSAHYDLSGLNCEVHTAADPQVIELVDDKMAFTEWLGDDVHRADATEVVGADSVSEEYYRRLSEGRDVCVKPVIGVNGNGYWHLTASPSVEMLDNPDAREIHPEVYLHALAVTERRSDPQRMLVMDWLPGPEVSVDLLCWRGTALTHAARTKIDGNTQRIQSEHSVIAHTRSVAEKLGLHGIISTQYRLDTNHDWRMLEVNPRPAGGSINSEDAGFGIISGWAQLVSGTRSPTEIAQYEADVMMTFKRTGHVTENIGSLITR